MTRTQVFTRKASMTAAGAALALGAGILSMGPAQAETPSAAGSETAQQTQQNRPETLDQAALVRSATDPTVYFLKVPSPNGIGEVPAPDATYSVDVVSGGQAEHFTVDSHNGRLDLKDSQILQTAEFEPFVSVNWIG